MQENKDLAVAYWQKGKDAAAQSDWKTAVDMFRQAVVLAPTSVHTRRALRDAQSDARGNRPVSKIESAKLLTIKTKIGVFRTQKKWIEVEKLAEDALSIDPRDADMNTTIAVAWNELGFPKLAVYGFETALKLDGKNKRALVAAAEMYEQQNQLLKARGLWERVIALEPANETAQQKVSSLEAQEYMAQKEIAQDEPSAPPEEPIVEPVHLEPALERIRESKAASAPTPVNSNTQPAHAPATPAPKLMDAQRVGVVQPSATPAPSATSLVQQGGAQDANQMTLLTVADNYILQGKMAEGAAVLKAVLEITGDPEVAALLQIVSQGAAEQKVLAKAGGTT